MTLQRHLKALTAAAIGVAMALPLAGTAAAQSITLRYADQFPLTHAASRLSAQPFRDLVAERSDGDVEIQLFPAEQLARAAGLLDAVRNRVADIAFVGVVYVTDRMPLTSAVELPGMFTDAVAGSAAFTDLVMNDLIEREYLPNRVRPLFTMVAPPYQLMFAQRRELNDIGDLSQLRLRAAGATGEMIAESLGAVAVRVPASDLYLALDRGTVDGAIYNPPSLFAYNIQEVLSSITTNASLGTVAFAALINEDVWQGLPEDVQAMLMEVSEEVGTAMAEQFQASMAGAYQRLDDLGITLIELSPETQAQFGESLTAVEEVWVRQMAERGQPGEEILGLFRGYLAAHGE
ncbi:MAG: TRAP transporter substrate-binding protein DctP [Pararhodobacter sp.]|nr:TRAP transporter substrate-binding protein DctP [Pararhodobacter sp.]